MGESDAVYEGISGGAEFCADGVCGLEGLCWGGGLYGLVEDNDELMWCSSVSGQVHRFRARLACDRSVNRLLHGLRVLRCSNCFILRPSTSHQQHIIAIARWKPSLAALRGSPTNIINSDTFSTLTSKASTRSSQTSPRSWTPSTTKFRFYQQLSHARRSPSAQCRTPIPSCCTRARARSSSPRSSTNSLRQPDPHRRAHIRGLSSAASRL